MLDTRTHGILDYLVGALLLLAPYVLGFANGGPEQWVPQAQGAVTIAMSLVTRYELSIAKLILFSVHLVIDAIGAALLLLSPWIFGFADRIWWPHVVVGIVEIVVVVLSLGGRRVNVVR